MADCEMGGRPEPAPWFIRFGAGAAAPAPVETPDPGPPRPDLDRLVEMVAPVVAGWVSAADVRQVIDELCHQAALALHCGQTVVLPDLGTLRLRADGLVSYWADEGLLGGRHG